jgi:NADH dehydrogenase (ubiquinone) 1 alpha subcomplex subunit 13
MGAICVYGFYEVINGIKERREMAREKMWTRIHLIPMLQAETDRDDVRRYWAAQEREKELMKDVKGWEFGSVYNSDRYVLHHRRLGKGPGRRGWLTAGGI